MPPPDLVATALRRVHDAPVDLTDRGLVGENTAAQLSETSSIEETGLRRSFFSTRCSLDRSLVQLKP